MILISFDLDKVQKLGTVLMIFFLSGMDSSNVAPRNRCAEKPMDPSDFQRVEQELQQQVHGQSSMQSKSLQNAQAWSSAPLGIVFNFNSWCSLWCLFK